MRYPAKGGLSKAEAALHVKTKDKGLQKGALGLVATMLMSIASCGPALVLAVIVGAVVSIVGVQAPGVMLVAVIPVLCILVTYREFHAAYNDCGTTFVWIGRAIGPKLGFISGWAQFGANILIMPASAYVIAQYGFGLVGLEHVGESALWTTLLGLAIIGAISFVCYVGIEAASLVQRTLVLIELVLVGLILAVICYRIATGDVMEGAATPALNWFNPVSASMVDALVVGVFAFWGWEVTFTLGEETGGSKTPAHAAIQSLGVLVILYLVSVTAFLAFAGPEFLSENRDFLLGVIGGAALGDWAWAAKLLVLCVFTSAIAAAQTTVLAGARVLLSMGAYGALPPSFGLVNRFKSPGFATVFFGLVAAVLLLGLSCLSDAVMFDSLSATGMLISFYYAINGFSCVWYFRSTLMDNLRNFWLRGVLPFAGGSSMAALFVLKASDDYSGVSSSSTVFGVGVVFLVAATILAVGLLLMALLYGRQRAFFTGYSLKSAPAMQPVEAG